MWGRTATKNQLPGQLDRAFPGLALVLPDALGTKVGRLVAGEFADPGRPGKPKLPDPKEVHSSPPRR